MKRKLCSFLLVLSMMSTAMVYADTTMTNTTNKSTTTVVKFKDLPDTHWAKKSIDELVKAGLLKGYQDGTVKPDGNITRAEFVTMINSMMGYKDTVEKTKFTDVASEKWYYKNILIAEKYAYIAGFKDGTFKPNDNITKEQVCVILAKVLNLAKLPGGTMPKDKVSGWAKESVEKVLSNRLMSLDKNGNFKGSVLATRADVASATATFVATQNKMTATSTKSTDTKKADTTQKKSAGTTTPQAPSGGGGGGGSTTTPTTNPSTPTTAPTKISKDEANKTIQNVITTLDKSKGMLDIKSANQINFLDEVKSAMNSYLNDNSLDVKAKANEVKEKYSTILTEKEKEDLKTWVGAGINMKDVENLKTYFDLQL